MVMVNWTYINPGQINTRKIRGQIQAANLNAARRWKKMLNEYVSTWNHGVEFKINSGYKGGYIFTGITTDDEIFWYLELGTWVRYATMTDDFIPKTAYHQIKSGQGQGGLQYVSTNMERPGIEPRAILEEIASIDAPYWERDIEKVFTNIHFTSGAP